MGGWEGGKEGGRRISQVHPFFVCELNADIGFFSLPFIFPTFPPFFRPLPVTSLSPPLLVALPLRPPHLRNPTHEFLPHMLLSLLILLLLVVVVVLLLLLLKCQRRLAVRWYLFFSYRCRSSRQEYQRSGLRKREGRGRADTE